MSKTSVIYAGIELRTPLLVAASGLTESVERVKKAEKYGAGGVVVKTLFEERIMCKSPTPRFTVLSHGFAGDRSLTFYSIEQGAQADLDGYCEELIKMKEQTGIAIIGSIGCVNDEEWIRYAKAVEKTGVDAIELNLSCPHSNLVNTKATTITDTIDHVTRLVRKHVTIPIIPKMTPQMNDPVFTAKLMEAAGANACCAFSRFLGLDIDIENQAPIMHGGYAGHGGPWAINYALNWITKMFPAISIPISASGGVTNWRDVVKYLLAGANNVQVCATVYMRGYEVLESLSKGLARYMDEHGYENIAQFRGAVIPKIKGLYEFERRKVRVARIDEDKCTGCGSCEKSCIYFAIEKGKSYRVTSLCDGCGMCAQVCPVQAIQMVPYED